MGSQDSVGVQSVGRACALLAALGDSPNGLSLAEVSRAAGLHKSTAHRLLATLSAAGLVRQAGSDSNYVLGAGLLALGEAARNHLLGGPLVQDTLNWLRAQTDETVHLGLPDRYELVYCAKVESSQSLKVASRIGAHTPLYCTGLGKAYLAFTSEAFLANYLAAVPLERRTATTIVDPAELRSHLAETRGRGWSIDDSENELGVRCIGAPVLDASGSPCASVSVTAPTARLDPEHYPGVAEAVVEAAARLGKLISDRLSVSL